MVFDLLTFFFEIWIILTFFLFWPFLIWPFDLFVFWPYSILTFSLLCIWKLEIENCVQLFTFSTGPFLVWFVTFILETLKGSIEVILVWIWFWREFCFRWMKIPLMMFFSSWWFFQVTGIGEKSWFQCDHCSFKRGLGAALKGRWFGRHEEHLEDPCESRWVGWLWFPK